MSKTSAAASSPPESTKSPAKLVGREMFGYALIHAFIASAEQHHAVELGQPSRVRLAKQFARSREQHDRRLRLLRKRIPHAHQRFHSLEQRLGLEHHAFAPAKRTIVHGAMAIMREFAQILHVNMDQAGFSRTAHNAVIERPGEKFRKNS